ncbi:MAG: hypothetical protein ACKVUT_04035 [Gaiella sp.]
MSNELSRGIKAVVLGAAGLCVVGGALLVFGPDHENQRTGGRCPNTDAWLWDLAVVVGIASGLTALIAIVPTVKRVRRGALHDGWLLVPPSTIVGAGAVLFGWIVGGLCGLS